MANEDSTSNELNPCMSRNLPDNEQIEAALYDIAHMADALRNLCTQAIQDDETGLLTSAAEHLALKIGWTADRCLGFQVNSSDGWLMTPLWNQLAKKANQQEEK